jgi:hypothetical protein
VRARSLLAMAAIGGLLGSPVPETPKEPAPGVQFDRIDFKQEKKRRRRAKGSGRRRRSRRLKTSQSALCHHTRWTVRRGTLKATQTAWLKRREEAEARWARR